MLLHEIAPSHILSLSLKFGMTGPERAEEIRRGMKRLDRDEAKRLAYSYYLEGLALAKEGNLPAAIGNLEKSDLLDPVNKQVEDKLEGFKAEFASQTSRQVTEVSAILARQQYQQGNILVSLEYWKAVLQVDPANEEAKQAVETIKSRLGSQETEMLARAQRDIIDVQVSQFLTAAQALREQGLLAEAAGETRKALAADNGNERAKSFLAELDRTMREKVDQLSRQAALEDEKKDFKASVAAYQAILQMSPASPGIAEKLKNARAAVSVKVKPALKKEAERLYYVAVDQYLKKQYPESSKTLSRIFELDPGNEGASKLKAKLEAALK
jgi:tetratricopeptide (TPR) repeat protein